MKTNAICFLSITALVVAVFAGAFGFGLINLDDYSYLCQEQIVGGLSIRNLKWAFLFYEEAIWMPLTWISYQFDYAISGGRSLHLHSVVLHAVNAVLVFIFLRQLFPRSEKSPRTVLIPAVGALFWALHPLRVESVVWLASRKDLVSFLGLIASLNVWLFWRRSGRGICSSAYFFSLVLFAMGGLAKSSVMTLPFLMLALDGCYNGWERLKRSWVPYLPFFFIAVCIALEGAIVQRMGGGMDDVEDVALWWRLLNAATSYGIYLIHTVLPFDLAAQCTMRYPGLPRLFLPGVAVAALCGWHLCAHWRTLRGPLAAGLLWFTLSVGPMLGIMAFGYHAFADRFTYIPSVGLSIILCGILSRVRWESPKFRVPCVVSFLAILAALSLATIRQIGYWEDDGKLFAHTLEVDGDSNAPAKMSLGWYLYEFKHDVRRASDLWRDAYALNPGMILCKGQYYMFILCEAGLLEEALEFKRAMSEWNDTLYARNEDPLKPFRMSWHYSLARLALLVHDPTTRRSAKAEIDEYLAKHTKNIRDWIYLRGRAELLDGNDAEAKRIWSTMPRSDCMTEGRYMIYRFTGNR